MLQIQNISKKYVTGDLTQTALDGVSLNLRESEFVAILGHSGSGKTTLLNMIGGLDRYDSGDLIINGISTKAYRDRDWDSYRNHSVGFVFQSYNLIPHQSVLSNVELALTISGVGRAEHRRRAQEALEQVGLGDQAHKKPNQMSGGQMQRVAIARALVNNPSILLADEPTGALDSDTSVQVMELLRQVAKDRLVVMVTHNPELAQQYASRIVRLQDGKITDDSDPYLVDESALTAPRHENMGKASMSYGTALSLSFNNLKTKKGRTLLTAFAGSIGIIGIALILSLSNGVNNYITDIQKDTMASYPITIEEKSIDLTSLMQAGMDARNPEEVDHGLDAVYSNGRNLELVSTMTNSISENNLTAFKKYLDDPASEIHQYIGENGIAYSYGTKFDVYAYDPDDTLVNTDGSTLKGEGESPSNMAGNMPSSPAEGMSAMGSIQRSDNGNFAQLLANADGTGISGALTDNYEVLYGSWPSAYNEVVLALDANNEISAVTLYELGLLPAKEYKELTKRIDNGEEVTVDTRKFSYEELCAQELYLLPACDTYLKGDNGYFADVTDDPEELDKLVESAVRLKIVGVVRAADTDTTLISAPVGYTKALTDYLVERAEKSDVVRAQKDSPTVNVLNGLAFAPADDAARIADTKTYLASMGVSDKANMCRTLMSAAYAGNTAAAQQLASMSETQLAAMLDSYLLNPDDEVLLKIYDNYVSAGDYDDNLKDFGMISLDAPSSISLYADSFDAKDGISQSIDHYNASAGENDKITYTDYVGLLMSSVTTIINVITYVLVAFVAVSLVVSSNMIGIITYISVLERTKEIGILRAIGASKRNISQVFNAETFIIGLCSGLIGVGVSLLLLLPLNALVHHLADNVNVNASLPPVAALILVLLSMVLTLIGGLIPSKKAARKDPVTALRTE
jgi:putative ABC transport system permease protein